jgi:hypothetical protein
LKTPMAQRNLAKLQRIWGTFESTTRPVEAKQVINLEHYVGAILLSRAHSPVRAFAGRARVRPTEKLVEA